ncbi:hypothetical protein [Novosphingobium album (ex Hu et al. 2023)]|uniref:Uncharacterized protein n=1 Tax=Novosphingobium album (ex Hu et al. 2023) TaxID=2930093 RepID=A0ABT0B0P9_9SPHN|nr:hypothetical protein [Novosphingobium album (ex Hu et al. 2023)]MCJ2178602.1 hypothetical protein [Novosphingobium album (ex Hu et al. 2023)]
MADGQIATDRSVEYFPGAIQSTTVTDELSRILSMLQSRCPRGALISFDFDGKLHVHIDLRSREDVNVVEALLPTLGPGLFHTFSRHSTPHRPFFHRISARVEC